jgi:sugar phosphate isomerase/epimerase
MTAKFLSAPMDPRRHPDDARRAVKPPDQATFDHRLQFMALRSLGPNYLADLDRYTRQDRLGDVIWPHYQMLYAANIEAMVKELKRRGLYLFDIWGFVPGSGPGDWQQFKVPEGVLPLFERELGDHWLGMDNGEQDGRYIGGYAGQMVPDGADRAEQYLGFQRHFERLGDLLGNKMATLVSLSFGHYFMREGVYTLIGAETAQALPNSQVYYAFIRGAGKQYGVPWFGNISVFNRWGYKHYTSNDPQSGKTKGTSLALMKRLMYTQMLYNSVAVGFETAFYDQNDQLSPVGTLQQNAVRWSETHGDPGVMHVPVAVMVDFLAGWAFPRHLYSGEIYKVWGALPYDAGDYLTDGVLDLLYPGYQDASFFHDERGFMTSTPFGDLADCLLSDAPGWLLRQYAVLVLAGRLEPSAELADTLAAYVRQGGHLVLTAANAAGLFPNGIAGVRILPETVTCATAQGAVMLHALELSDTAEIVCHLGGKTPAAARGTWGRGQVTVFASPYGIAEMPQDAPPAEAAEIKLKKACRAAAYLTAIPAEAGEDQPLAKPYPLLSHVRDTLTPIFQAQMFFGTAGATVGDGLSLVTCRRAAGEYTVALCNHTWEAKPFALSALAGAITKVTELATDTAEKSAVGFLPETVTAAVGEDTGDQIAGGAVRLFRVLTDETRGASPVEAPPAAPPPPNPTRRGLALRNPVSIRRELLLRPTFFRHFDTVLVDWRYVAERDAAALASQADWLKRQGVRIVVDVSSGINLFPDFRLVDNDPQEHARSLAGVNDVLDKMTALGAKDLVISLHRAPENNYTREQYDASVTDNCRTLARRAASTGITVHLRQTPKKETPTLDALAQWVNAVKEPNFRAAPALAALLVQDGNPAALAEKLAAFPCDLVLLAACERDAYGQLWNLHAPLCRYAEPAALAPVIAALKKLPCLLVLDACYPSRDDEYRDARLLETQDTHEAAQKGVRACRN